jgi:hypothetical protein
MGCGASNNSVTNAQLVSHAAIAPTLPQQQQKEEEEIIRRPLIAPQISPGNRL